MTAPIHHQRPGEGQAGAAPGVRRWLLGSCGGLALWASSFVVLYALLSLGCAAGWQALPVPGSNGLTAVLVAAWLAHLLALAALLWWIVRRWPAHGTLPRLARALTVVALIATVWTGWPLLVLPPCAGQESAASWLQPTGGPCSMT